jgi:hypothetical protein
MIVGLIKTMDTTFLFVFVRLLKSHFSKGILERKGTPEADSLFSVLSIPPKATISSFFTLIMDLNLLVEVGGGSVIEVAAVKSEIFTPIFKVTWSSPDTIGMISIDILASTGIYCWVTTVWGLREPSTFWVEIE